MCHIALHLVSSVVIMISLHCSPPSLKCLISWTFGTKVFERIWLRVIPTCRCDAMIPIHSISAAFFPPALPSSRVMKMMNAAQGKKSKWSRMQKFVVNLLGARLFSCSCMAISSPAYTLIATSLLFALLFLIFAHVDDVWNHLVKKRNCALFRLK